MIEKNCYSILAIDCVSFFYTCECVKPEPEAEEMISFREQTLIARTDALLGKKRASKALKEEEEDDGSLSIYPGLPVHVSKGFVYCLHLPFQERRLLEYICLSG